MGDAVLPAEEFDSVYAAMLKSPTWIGILKDVFGDEYLDGYDAFSYLPLSTLRGIVSGLDLAPGKTFVDLASGLGGLGQWVAQETGASVVGVDYSAFACTHAANKASERGLGAKARYVEGDVTATGLEGAAFDAAASLGVMLFVPDSMAALREAARILKPGGRFVLVTYDHDIPLWATLPEGGYRTLLPQVGFEVLSYESVPNWYADHKRIHGGILAKREALANEMGDAHAAHLVREAESAPLDHFDLFVAVCRKA